MLRSANNHLSRVSCRILAALENSPSCMFAVASSSDHHPQTLSRFSLSFYSFSGRPMPPTQPDPQFLFPKSLANFSALFSSGSGSDTVSKEVLVQHLVVKDDDLMLLSELQKRISHGEDLGDLAREYSICSSKKEGGNLGWISRAQLAPEFEEAAFLAPINEIVRCKTKSGWHLFRVLSKRESFPEIQVVELHSRMQDPSFMDEAQLIDVREPDEIAKASLPGFKVLPLSQFDSWAPEITSMIHQEKDTFVMCRSGRRSLQVAKWLETQGFERVYNVAGGIQAYAHKVDPSVPVY